MKEEYILLIIIVFIIIMVLYCKFYNNDIEGMATTEESATSITAMNNEALQNVASLYNTSNAKISNLNITGEFGVAGTANFAETLGIKGTTTMANANVSGALTVGGISTFTGTMYANGTAGQYQTNFGVLYNNGTIHGFGTSTTGTWQFSIIASNRICGAEIWSTSSREHKKILDQHENSVVESAIDKLDKIIFYKYENIDKFNTSNHPNAVYYGVIAEQLDPILPGYVNHIDEYIPNIYKMSKINVVYCTGNNEYLYEITLPNAIVNAQTYLLNKCRFYANENECVKEICYDIKVNDDYTKLEITTSDVYPENSDIFVYGTYEKSANVNKERLGEMALLCVKHLIKKHATLEENMQIEINQLKEENKIIKQNNETNKNELVDLKNKYNDLLLLVNSLINK